MKVICNKNKCPQNHTCPLVYHCPTKAISQKGYSLPKVDNKKCTNCGICINNCPYYAFENEK